MSARAFAALVGGAPATNSQWLDIKAATGMKAITMDPALCQSALAPTSGNAYGIRCSVAAGATLTNFCTFVTTAGTGITLAKGGVYSLSGTQLAVTANDSANYATSGFKSTPFITPYTVPSATDVYLVFLMIGTTTSTMPRSGGVSTAASLNFGQTQNRGILLGSVTDLNPTINVGTLNTNFFLFGAS